MGVFTQQKSHSKSCNFQNGLRQNAGILQTEGCFYLINKI
jgi:hypothetical protein